MKSTGVVRKIDDLGRIVIPKEIRKTLGIRDGENLEIYIEDNSIKLLKSNIINNYIDEVKDIIEATSIIVSGNIIITDREKVIASNSNLVTKGDKLSIKLTELIDERINYNDDKLNELEIGNISLKGYFIIVPIISEGNSLGLIIINNQDNSVADYYVTAKLIASLLARKIDISC